MVNLNLCDKKKQGYTDHCPQIIYNKHKKENILNLTVPSAVEQLAHRGWHQVNRQEEFLAGEGRRGGRW